MTPRDIIQATLRSLLKKERQKTPWGDAIVSDLAAAGYVILPAAEVEAIRNKALEEAAVAAERTYAKDPFRFELNTAAAAAIRALKGAKS